MKTFIGVIYTDDVMSNDIVTIQSKDRVEADEMLRQYANMMFDDDDELCVVRAETYMPDAIDATLINWQILNAMK